MTVHTLKWTVLDLAPDALLALFAHLKTDRSNLATSRNARLVALPASPLTRGGRSRLLEGASEAGPGIALSSTFPTYKPKILEILITPNLPGVAFSEPLMEITLQFQPGCSSLDWKILSPRAIERLRSKQ